MKALLPANTTSGRPRPATTLTGPQLTRRPRRKPWM